MLTRKVSFSLFVLAGLLLALLTLGAPAVFADDPFPTNTPGPLVMVTSVPLDVSFAPFNDETDANAVTDTEPRLYVVQQPPVEPGIPINVALVAIIVVGVVFSVIVIVWGLHARKTGEQLFNSWPAPVRYAVRAGGEYLLEMAAKTPEPDDDQAVIDGLVRVGFTVTRNPDGSYNAIPPARPTSPPIPST